VGFVEALASEPETSRADPIETFEDVISVLKLGLGMILLKFRVGWRVTYCCSGLSYRPNWRQTD
jgi:hypothetical protein